MCNLAFRKIALAAACVMLGAIAAQPTAAQAPVAGGHFRRLLSSDPANLDPAQTNTVRAIAVKMSIFDPLLDPVGRRDPRSAGPADDVAACQEGQGLQARNEVRRRRSSSRFTSVRSFTVSTVCQ